MKRPDILPFTVVTKKSTQLSSSYLDPGLSLTRLGSRDSAAFAKLGAHFKSNCALRTEKCYLVRVNRFS